MIADERVEFADVTSVAGAVPGVVVGDVVDIGTDGVNLVDGLYLIIRVEVDVLTVPATQEDPPADPPAPEVPGTIEFQLVSDAQAALATDGSATLHLKTRSFVTDVTVVDADLTGGTLLLVAPLPRGQYERYLGVIALAGTTDIASGEITAFLTAEPGSWKAFPSQT